MSKKPEALELAQWLETGLKTQRMRDCATELRRQHAEIERLSAEVERLRASISELEAENFILAAGQCVNVTLDDGGTPRCKEIERLSAEVERLRADAERYRWLRSRIPGGTYRIMGVIYSEGGNGVDAAIDAAREGGA